MWRINMRCHCHWAMIQLGNGKLGAGRTLSWDAPNFLDSQHCRWISIARKSAAAISCTLTPWLAYVVSQRAIKNSCWLVVWNILNLVGGLEHFLFSHILGIIIPIDYFSEGFKPPTRLYFPYPIGSVCMLYMATFTINIPLFCWHQSTIHTDPMGTMLGIFILSK